jgi:hypothetical protein
LGVAISSSLNIRQTAPAVRGYRKPFFLWVRTVASILSADFQTLEARRRFFPSLGSRYAA